MPSDQGATGERTLAVVVLAHDAPAQLTRLVRRLETGTRTAVFVHHDPSGAPAPAIESSQTRFVPDPVACRWGRASIVDAVLHSLDVVRAATPDLGWVLLVSGADYPVRTMASIEAELATSPYDAWLRSFPLGRPEDDVVPWQAVCRRRYLRAVRAPGTPRSVPLPVGRPTPFGPRLAPHIGDLWVNLGAAAVDAVLDSPHRRRLRRYAGTVAIPDELVVPTLVHHGIAPERVGSGHRRFIEWPGGGSPHPETITQEHLPAIRASEAFFARKLPAEDGGAVADLLDDLAGSRRA